MKRCSSQFTTSFKFANLTPVYRQVPRNQKVNYGKISILLVVSKIFETSFPGQVSQSLDKFHVNLIIW